MWAKFHCFSFMKCCGLSIFAFGCYCYWIDWIFPPFANLLLRHRATFCESPFRHRSFLYLHLVDCYWIDYNFPPFANLLLRHWATFPVCIRSQSILTMGCGMRKNDYVRLAHVWTNSAKIPEPKPNLIWEFCTFFWLMKCRGRQQLCIFAFGWLLLKRLDFSSFRKSVASTSSDLSCMYP